MENLQDEILAAYKKLKSYVYHENFSLDLRHEIAEFESNGDINDKIKLIAESIEMYIKNQTGFEKHFESIDYRLYPKSINRNKIENNDGGFYFSNSNNSDSYLVEKETYFIKCNIELHILSILWIMKFGHHLDGELSNSCYGNRLERNSEAQYENYSIKLFTKYFSKYNAWRDEAIKKSIELHNTNLNVSILNLDIKNYYHSIDYDFSTLIERFKESEFNWLNLLLKNIHEAYQLKINSTKKVLPIGLISSGILANYYLIEFDKNIECNIRPAFYGRYVDDILMVFCNPIITLKSNPVTSFIKEHLINKRWNENVNVKIEVEQKNTQNQQETEYTIGIHGNKLIFQNSKVKLYHFHSNESIEVLNRFEKEIMKNSSEFRFQPEEVNIFESFNSESYNILYSDTVNKLRSIDGFETNKLGASKHLRKLIEATKHTDNLSEKKIKDISEKIIDYFSGVRSLELYGLWEKAITFFVINKSKEHLIQFTKRQLHIIKNIHYKTSDSEEDIEKTKKIKEALISHLANTIAISISLNRSFFKESILNRITSEIAIDSIEEYLSFKDILEKADFIVNSNLLRHQYLYYPLLNYCNQSEDFSFINKQIKEKTLFTFCPKKIEFSPRFIHFHELELFYNLGKWFSAENEISKEINNNEILENYLKINKLKDDKSYKDIYPQTKNIDEEFEQLSIWSAKSTNSLKVGIVNIKVNTNNSLSSMKKSPNLSFERLNEINRVLNESITNNCDLVVFPEICIPLQWISIIADFAKRNNIGIIAGIEHFSDNKNTVFNYVVTILPFNLQLYSNALIDFRLKKDYSPSEKEQIKGRIGYNLPNDETLENTKLKIYNWKKTSFSVLNCFELTDISKRAMFRGKVDFLVTVEHNRDVNYFSNITESFARDVHSYIVQVNTSNYGDSRITQPSESQYKDIIKIKGGENVSIITGYINIKSLRDFQSLDESLQKERNDYKLTPPNFKKSENRK